MLEPGPDQTRWFSEKVHAHETSLRCYVRAAFAAVRDVDDVVQESFLRTWRALLSRPIASTRHFLLRSRGTSRSTSRAGTLVP